MAKLSAYPPVTRALPELKLVATNVVNVPDVIVALDKAEIYPPLITALPELKFVACSVVKFPVPGVTLPIA